MSEGWSSSVTAETVRNLVEENKCLFFLLMTEPLSDQKCSVKVAIFYSFMHKTDKDRLHTETCH